MWQAIRQAYDDTYRFILAFPLLAGLIVVLEGAQHIVEWFTGFYAGAQITDAAQANPVRLSLGAAKTVAILLVGYWVARYLLSNGSSRFTTRSELRTLRRYGYVALGYVLISAAAALMVAVAGAQLLGAAFLPVLVILTGAAIRTLLSFWMTGAAVGDRSATLAHSVRDTRGSVLWGTALVIVAWMPPVIVHYALGKSAVGAPSALVGLILIVDTLVVGFMGVLLSSIQVQVARRVATRSGHALTTPALAAE